MGLVLNSSSKTVNKYLKNVSNQNVNTAEIYQYRLNSFTEFIRQEFNLSLDELITTLTTYGHGPKIDVYELLSSYVSYLKTVNKLSPSTMKQNLSTIRNYLESSGIELSPRRYKLNVKTPRVVRSKREALTKKEIRTILGACESIALKTYILFLAATGCRATEALSIRECDIHYDTDPATISLRGEYTKTQTDRDVILTSEVVAAIKLMLDYKFRTRKVHFYKDGKSINEIRTPKPNKDLFIFSSNTMKNPTLAGLYSEKVTQFEHVLDRLGGKFSEYENNTKRRRKITLHSFRRFVKSTVSDLGYFDFSEWILGHAGSPYYQKSDKEKYTLFKKIEPYLTFLDQTSLERESADLKSRVESLESDALKWRKYVSTLTRTFKEYRDISKRLDQGSS